MSDQTKAGDGIHENHWCEHPGCTKWGGWGFSPSKAEKPHWWCPEHYPHRDKFRASGLSPSFGESP